MSGFLFSGDGRTKSRAAHRVVWPLAVAAGLAFSLLPVTAAAFNITGAVFEDVQYGGGAGRTRAASSGSLRANARVELFDNAGAFVSSTTTDGSGAYAFNGLANGTYTVRVVNSTVTSSRTGHVAGLLPVQTFRTNASSGSAVGVTDHVGGEVPSKADAGDGSTTLAALTTATTTAQSITTVTSSGSNVTGVEFGFNFNTIVNVNDTGQGSLREFLINSNTLGNTGLAIQGQTAGEDVSIFMISDGAAHAGLRAGLSNLLTSGVAVVTPATALPTITAAGTTIDGSTQTANVGNTNAVVLGTGGIVGVDGLALGTVAGPEVEIRDTGSLLNGLQIQADDVTIRSLAILGFGSTTGEAGIHIDDTFTGALIEDNVLGSTATSFTDPGASLHNWAGVYSGGGDDGTIQNNLIGFSSVTGIYFAATSSNWTISGNEIRDVGLDTQDGDGITLSGSTSNAVTGNLIVGSSSQAIVGTGPATSNTFTNNTATGNGVGVASGISQSPGITIRSGANGNVFDRNLVHANYGAGFQINNGATGTVMTRNSIYDNGTITARNGSAATGQIGIDLDSPTDNGNMGTAPFVTVNDAGDVDAGGNALTNYPILVTASLSGGNLVVTGYARPGSLIELFVADADPSGFGEGAMYLMTLTEGGTGAGGTDPYADTDAGTGTYGPGAINGVAQGTDLTNLFSFTAAAPPGVVGGTSLTATATLGGQTSEFSGLVSVTSSIAGTVFEDLNYGGGAGRTLAASSGVGRPDARVELFDNAGAFVTSTTTQASGAYVFSGLGSGTYTVRVVNDSVSSSRTGYVSSLRAVQTFRTNASSGTAAAVTDHVGGQDPSVADAGVASPGAVMNTTTGVFTAGIAGTAQSVTSVATAGAVTGVDFGYSFDVVVNRSDQGQGSLRQFVLNANALANAGLAQSGRPAGIDNAVLMLADGTARPGLNTGYTTQFVGGVATVALASALPAVSSPAVIDAQTQPGWSAAPIVELNGAGAGGGASGLTLTGGATTVRGLVINRFASNGILITSAADTVAGCYVGTNAAGTAASANGGSGIYVIGASNVLGGVPSAHRNVISGNTGSGVLIELGGSTGNQVQGNAIGTDAAGTGTIANGGYGVLIQGGAAGNTIGGTAAGTANTIVASTSEGVAITGAGTRQNGVLGNSIHDNGGIGITIGAAGVTPNDGAKNVTLPNDDMDHPVFTSAILAAGSLTVTGYVGSAAGQAAFAGARVEIFESDGDASGYGEGRTYLGALTADASGNFSGTVTASGLAIGEEIAGTATDATNSTSEFGAQHTVGALNLVKRAFRMDGTPIPTGTLLAKGIVFKFLIYVSNPGSAVPDLSLRDVLDPAFVCISGSIRVDNSRPSCATGTCSAVEEAAIFTAANTGTAVTDAIDGDRISRIGATLDAGNGTAANAQLDIAANKVYAVMFTVRMQ